VKRKLLAAAALVAAAGCNRETLPVGGGPPDLTFVFPDWTGDFGSGSDDAGALTACGDDNPSCSVNGFGPMYGGPFPLSTDMPADPNVNSDGVNRDKNGYLRLNLATQGFDYAWTANTEDWNFGTVSKFDTKTMREVARYFSVTCHSLPTGNRNACDGVNGCCANDSYPQWKNRKAKLPDGPAQQVEMTHINYPSRTAIDIDGTMWVANRAYVQQGAQSSVTKVAVEISKCRDYNKNGVIDTSRDVNGDGVIQTDCNGNSIPDDIDDVKQTKCTNGMQQEFYGLDDECVLLTTNTGDLDQWGRPLALGPGPKNYGPSDVWAGLFNSKQVFRIDGTTGKVKDETTLQCQPYGFVIDAQEIGWAANLGPGGCYWDTKNVANVGTIRNSTVGGQSSYGISMDRDQNIWFGGGAARYTPVRNGSFADLGQGYWTVIDNIGSSGVAVDSRSPNAYFAYFVGAKLWQVPASTIPLPKGMDVSVSGLGFPTVPIDGDAGKGVDITVDGNVVVSSAGTMIASLTRVPVDAKGNMTAPKLNAPPQGNNLCPTGDNCRYTDRQGAILHPYTYSDFTGYALRNFTLPKGAYSYIQPGCLISGLPDGETRWISVGWDADVPPNTTLTLRVRSGSTPVPGNTWGPWTPDFNVSPADLVGGMVLIPNNKDSSYLQVEFDFATMDKNLSATLKSFYILHECNGVG
jgi:hypothetical protein